MFGFGDHEDFRPLCYIRGYPLYVSGLLVGVHVLAFILTAIFMATNVSLLGLMFVPGQFFSGYIWQLFTYPFVKLSQMTDPFAGIWFLIEMALLFVAGRELERHMGRWNFLNLYTWMVVIPAAVASLLAFGGYSTQLLGSFLVNVGVFFAFVVVYPGIPLLGGVPAKWVAIGFGAVWSLIFLAQNNWDFMLATWANGGYAYLAVTRYKQGNEIIFWPDFFKLFGKKHGFKVLPDPEPPRRQPAKSQKPSSKRITTSHGNDDPRAQLDALLDKIAEQGIGSLSAAERKQLEQLRERLMEQEGATEESR